MIYVSLALSATMLPNGRFDKIELTPAQVKDYLGAAHVVSALNPSHQSTIDAVRRRFGIELPLPAADAGLPHIEMKDGDSLIIVQAFFKRRLHEGEVYSDEEVEATPIRFYRIYAFRRIYPA